MKYRGLKRAIVMLLALTMLVTSSGMAVFAESLNEEATNPSQDAVTTEQAEEAQEETAKAEEAKEDAKEEAKEEAKDEASDKAAEDQKLTAKDWEKDLPKDVSKDVREAMAQVAKSQIGDEADLYKAFANADSIKDGDASFVMFVLEYANVLGVKKAIGDDNNGTVKVGDLEFPVNADIKKWVKELKNADIYKEVENDAIPEQGDIVFTHSIGNNDAAVVLSADEGKLEVAGIETEKKVDKVSKYTVDAEKIDGFVSLKDIAPEKFAEEQAEESAEEEAVEEDAEKADELTEEELAAKKAEEEAAAKAAEEAEKKAEAEAAGLSEQTIEAELTSAPGVSGKLRSLFTSTNGTEITVSGMLPEDATVKAYPIKVTIPGQNVLTAYDITIYTKDADGKEVEWQPLDALSVSIKDSKLKKAAKNDSKVGFNVYHKQDANAHAELITEADAAAKVTFDANSFSIYIVSQDAKTKTYTFMNGDDIYSKQVLQNGDELAEPQAPVKDGAVFKYWSLTQGGEKFEGYCPVTVTDETDNADVTLYAVYDDEQIVVTYYGQDGEVYRRDSYNRPTGENTEAVNTKAVDYKPRQRADGTFLKFRYWTDSQANLAEKNPLKAGDDGTITLNSSSSDVSLYPVISEGHWIYFDTNKAAAGGEDSSVTYIAPIFVVNGDETEITAGKPKTNGYTFEGWYTRKSGGDQIFDANGNKTAYTEDSSAGTYYEKDLLDHEGILANNPTLYAHWKMNTTANYTVIIWKQKITDTVGTADENKKYDYEESFTRSGNSGDTVTPESGDINKNYTGFSYNGTSSDTSKTLAANGSTVLNVYYDRDQVSINFYTYSNRAWRVYKTFNGLYQQTFEQAKYTWPTEYWWFDNGHGTGGNKSTSWTYSAGDVSGGRTTFLAAFILTDGGTTANYYGSRPSSTATTIKFHQQNLNDDGTAATSYKKANSVDSTIGPFSISDKYTGFKAVRYTNNDNPGGETLPPEPPITDSNGNKYYAQVSNQDLNIYFDRVKSTITFKKNDGTTGDYTTKDNVPFEAPLNKWMPDQNPTREGYTFTGWYFDKDKNAPVTEDDTMPANNISLYAGWEKIRYEVNIEPEGGEIGAPNNTHSTYFKNDFDQKVEEYTDVQRNYVKVGPATGGDTRARYSYVEYKRSGYYKNGELIYGTITEDPTITDPKASTYEKRTAKYVPDSEGIYVEEENAYTLQGWYEKNGDTISTTPFNFNDLLTHDTTIAADWRRTSPYTVVYDAGDGVRKPTDANQYIEGANAIAAASLGAPSGQRFVGWQVKKGDETLDTVYAPNSMISITEDKAVEQKDHSMLITLIAKYEPSTLPDGYMADYTFITDDPSSPYYVQTIAAGETLVNPPEPPKQAGKVFDGWYYDQQGKHRFEGFGKIDSPVYTTLYAHYKTVFTVTYHMPGTDDDTMGSEIITTQNYEPNDQLNTLYVDCPTDDEHMVLHWRDAAEKQYPYKAFTKGDTYKVTTDLVLWPVLAEQKYIHFDLQNGKTSDGAAVMDPVKIPAQGWPSLPAEPVRPGYNFEGWYTHPNGEGFEYKFNEEVDTFKNRNHLTGNLTLYAKWDLDTAHPTTSKLTILWYAQLPANLPNRYLKSNYELVHSKTVSVNTGEYTLDTESDDPNTAATATATINMLNSKLDNSIEGSSIYGTDCLVALYSEESGSRYNKDDLSIFFEKSTHNGTGNDAEFTVDDSGSSTLAIYFDRKVYHYVFNPNTGYSANSDSGTSITNYGNKVYKGTTSYPVTSNDYYSIDVWLGKDVYDEWPVLDDENGTRKNAGKAWVNWNPNNSSTGSGSNAKKYIFNGWTNHDAGNNNADAINYMTAVYSINASAIKTINTKNGTTTNNNTLTFGPIINNLTNEAIIQYYFDGDINHDYDQKMFISSTSTKRYTTGYSSDVPTNQRKKFYGNYTAKSFDGYEAITVDNASITDPDNQLFCEKESDGKIRGEIISYTTGTERVEYPIYRYSIAPEWQNTVFYNGVHDRTVMGFSFVTNYEGDDPLYITDINAHAGESPHTLVDETTVNGYTTKLDDYRVRIGSDTSSRFKESGKVYYNISDKHYDSMTWNEFITNVIDVEEQTAYRNEDRTGTYINFYYQRKNFYVQLYDYNGVTKIGEPIAVKYNDYLPDLSSYIPDADEGEEFAGWSVVPNDLIPFEGRMPSHSIPLYAKSKPQTRTVTFKDCTVDDNGKFVYQKGASFTVSKDYNTELRDFIPDKPSKSNSTFAGWMNETGEQPVYLNTRVITNMTITPGFDDYTLDAIAYDLNGGLGTAPTDTRLYVEGAEVVALQGTGLTKSFTGVDGNYTGNFVCWNTAADGSGRTYYPGDSIIIGEDETVKINNVNTLTLYAQYDQYRETTLIYDKNATEEGAELASVASGASLAKEANGTVVIRFKDDKQTQDSGGGHPNTKVTIGQDKNKTEFVAKRPGYRFLGWAKTPTATEPEAVNGDYAYVNTLSEGGNTLYAVYERMPAYLKLENKSGSKDVTFRLTVNSGDAYAPYTETLWQKDAAASITKTANQDYYEIAVAKGTDKVLYLPKAAGLGYNLKVVYNNNEVADLSTIDLGWQSDKDDASGDLIAGTYVEAQANVKTEFGKLVYNASKKDYTYAALEDTEGVLRITKDVTGDYANKFQEFTFTLNVKDAADGTTYTTTKNETTVGSITSGGSFTLKDDEYIEIRLPRNKEITITENLENGFNAPVYECGDGTAAVTGESSTVENGQKLKLTAATGTLTVTNDFDDTKVVPSGISGQGYMLLLVVLAFVLGTAEFYILMRRRRVSR